MKLRIAADAARSAALLWVLVRIIILLFAGPIALGGIGSLGLALAIAFVVGFEQRREREDLFLENLGVSQRLAPMAAALIVTALEVGWTIGWGLGVES